MVIGTMTTDVWGRYIWYSEEEPRPVPFSLYQM